MPIDSTTRFSNRVDNYIKYRPRYPDAIIAFLREEAGLRSTHTIVDIGSGTGILSELFLRNGNEVIGVEPNDEMRAAGDTLLALDANFRSVDGTAEATTLPAACADFVTAGQAFHWFDAAQARTEFMRILKPGGAAVLVWNSRKLGNPFMEAYEEMMRRFADDYQGVSERNSNDEALAHFYEPTPLQVETFANEQVFDFAGLRGRALSSSYAPMVGHPQHELFMQALENLFDRYQTKGKVKLLYMTRVYWGKLP